MNFPELRAGDLLFSTESNAPILVVFDGIEQYFVNLFGELAIPNGESIYMVQRPIPDTYGDFWPCRCEIIFDVRHEML